MKILLFFPFLFLFACSGGGGGGGGGVVINSPMKNGHYTFFSENARVDFESKDVRILEVSGDVATYSMGVANVYSLNKDGTERSGVHPSPEFRNITAQFKVVPVSDKKVKLKFESSSCLNPNKNPFPEITEKEIVVTAADDTVSLLIGSVYEEAMVKLSDEDSLDFISSYKNVQVYCPGDK